MKNYSGTLIKRRKNNMSKYECDGRGCNCDGNAVVKIEYNPIEELDKAEKIRVKKRKVKKQMEANAGLTKQAKFLKKGGNAVVRA
jgi:hypothetical protein